MNNFTLRITGECELPSALKQDKEYRITITGQLDGIEEKNQHDGTFEYRHKLRLLTADLIDETGKSIKLIDKTKASVKLRRVIENHTPDNQDSEDYYQRVMKYLCIPEILDEIIKKLD